MLYVSVAPLTVWPGHEPFFVFSKPVSSEWKTIMNMTTIVVVESKEKDLETFYGLSERIDNIEDSTEHFFAICVLAEIDEVNEIFFHLDALLGARSNIKINIENPKKQDGEDVMFFDLMELKEYALIQSILRKEQQN